MQVGGQPHTLRARWVVLATGAVPQALIAAGLCERHTPSGVALRAYVHAPAMAGRIRSMDVVLGQALRPGYGWIFPAPGDCFNIGVGVVNSHHLLGGKGSKIDINLRTMFDAFCQHYAPAAELMQHGQLVGELKGAPLRCTLQGARWSRPGLLVTGEAAGSTYSCTGEGIGKAMETGMLAAQALLDGQRTDATDYAGSGAHLQDCYGHSLRALAPKFERWDRANRITNLPWLVDLLIWRAQHSPRLLARISQVLDETVYAGDLLSWRGLKRLAAG
jgi:flavin-dependent dehydrogenase